MEIDNEELFSSQNNYYNNNFDNDVNEFTDKEDEILHEEEASNLSEVSTNEKSKTQS